MAICPSVGVSMLSRGKINKERVWILDENSSSTEANIMHKSTNVYCLEISRIDNDCPLIEMEFQKMKFYIIKARLWHEVKYEGRLVALHFKDGGDFTQFYDMLVVVLKLHNKFTKPKNDEKFLTEVKAFDIKTLRSVPAESFLERKEQPQYMKMDGSRQLNQTIGGNRPLPKPPVTKQTTTPRNWKTRNQSLQSVSEEDPSSDTSDEVEDRSVRPLYLPVTDDEVPPFRSGKAAKNTTAAPLSRSVSDEGRPGVPAVKTKKILQQSHSELSVQRSPPTVPPRQETKPASQKRSGQASNTLTEPPNSQFHTDRPTQEVTPWRSNDNEYPHRPVGVHEKEDDEGQASGRSITQKGKSSHNLPTHLERVWTPLATRQESSSSPVASPRIQPMHSFVEKWKCGHCTLFNDPQVMCCDACKRMREDAWQCQLCATVYSLDSIHCTGCGVWRCRLCTFQNHNTIHCTACGQA